MRKLGFLIVSFYLLMLPHFTAIAAQDPFRVLVVSGGHNYDTTAFVELFQSLNNVEFDTVVQPRANELIASNRVSKYDVIVFYDMWKNITTDQQNAYLSLLGQGMGMVFLHHSLVSYQDWSEFKYIVGGKYHNTPDADKNVKPSGYKHDIAIPVRILDPAHPITKGMNDFTILDEGYIDIEILDEVTLLLAADHDHCHPYTGWTHEYKRSTVVYLLHGHDKHAYKNQSFRSMLQNAIEYAAK